jgi:molybdopterin-containing oxidoreductase family membrane subunit
MEFFIAWYSGALYEKFAFMNRAFGQYAWAYWIMVSCNVITPQLFWFKRIRTSIPAMFVLSLFVNVGMWFERYVIIVSSLANDFLPTSWDEFIPTWVDIATMLGAFGLFGVLFLLFCRYLPMIAIAEVKSVMPEANPHWEGYAKGHAHHGGAHHVHGGASAGSQPAFQDPRPGQP